MKTEKLMSVEDQAQTPQKQADDRDLTPPGEQLRRARERASMTLQEAARELRMPVARLRALEGDDYDLLKADTFVRGYVRAYARLLSLDPGPLLEAYQQRAGDFAGPAGSNVSLPEGVPKKSPWPLVIVVALVLAGLWLIAVWFFDNRSDRVAEPAIDESPAVIDPAPGEVVETPEQLPPESDVAPQALDIEPLAARPDTETTLDRLSLSFSGECWIEVSDAQGDVLHTNLQPPGSSLELRGRAPFNVRMGNATAVQMRLNGEPVDIPVRADDSVVSMSVGQQHP